MINEFYKDFTKLNEIEKTISFRAEPVWETKSYIEANGILNNDKIRHEKKKEVKSIISRDIVNMINNSLSTCKLSDTSNYSELYFKKNKDKTEWADFYAVEKNLLDEVKTSIVNSRDYKETSIRTPEKYLFSYLISKLTNVNEIKNVNEFKNFCGILKPFFDNVNKTILGGTAQGSVAFRCIHDNLPIFIENCKIFEKIKAELPIKTIEMLKDTYMNKFNIDINNAFDYNHYNDFLTQDKINCYNAIIGGYSTEIEKVKGINECINLFKQSDKENSNVNIPFMTLLQKQIMCDGEKISFIEDSFECDDELLSTVNEFHKETLLPTISNIEKYLINIDTYNLSKIYIKKNNIITFSKTFGCDDIFTLWKARYESENEQGNKTLDKYEEAEYNNYKKINAFSINEINNLIRFSNDCDNIIDSYKSKLSSILKNILDNYSLAENLIVNGYTKTYQRLPYDEDAVKLIKNYLDSIKEIEYFIRIFSIKNIDVDLDASFYSHITEITNNFIYMNKIYNKVRNYICKKIKKSDEFQVTFDTPTFLNGWSTSKEWDNSNQLYVIDDVMYLGVPNRSNAKNKSIITNYNKPIDETDAIKKLESNTIQAVKFLATLYRFEDGTVRRQIPGKDDEARRIELKTKYRDARYNHIQEIGSYKNNSENFSKDDLTYYINYSIGLLNDYEGTKVFNFKFKNAEDYESWQEFTNDLEIQSYKKIFVEISKTQLRQLVKDGIIYLFRLENKDNGHGVGKPNLFTVYTRGFLCENNNVNAIELLGGASMSYRPALILPGEIIEHQPYEERENKNPNNPNKTNTLKYPIIKDRRFTKPQYTIHLPFAFNRGKSTSLNKLNAMINERIKSGEFKYIISIDVGERNLIYIVISDFNGNIIKQYSLNCIDSHAGVMDYQRRIEEKSKEILNAQKNWESIDDIKKLKLGYCSQVIHEIAKFAIENKAIIIKEELDDSFKSNKILNQVYSDFENALIKKLSLYVDKDLVDTDIGGSLNPIQLTMYDPSNKSIKNSKQNGIIFKVNPSYTSKIDPTTGFISIKKSSFKYETIQKSKHVIKLFDYIGYDETEQAFKFKFNYKNIEPDNQSAITKWTAYSHGDRIFNGELVNITEKLKDVFFGMDYSGNLIDEILEQNNKPFFKELMQCIELVFQLRNSNSDLDFIISPVKNKNGEFFDSRNYVSGDSNLPIDADANGAYNIARKGLIYINTIKNSEDDKVTLKTISNKEWLKYAQQ